jgi:hypothetical protein
MKNPYPKTFIDEVSGLEMDNPDYFIWQQGALEVKKWVEQHQLIGPDDNSITQFKPYYHIDDLEKLPL